LQFKNGALFFLGGADAEGDGFETLLTDDEGSAWDSQENLQGFGESVVWDEGIFIIRRHGFDYSRRQVPRRLKSAN